MQGQGRLGQLTPPKESINALLQRIISSEPFQRSPRQRELLLFIAGEHLAGRADEISEQRIGCQVFGRTHGYNQAEDNIVRVAVRQLRARLSAYLEAQGREEPWLIRIPKGAYRLEFERRIPVEAVNTSSASRLAAASHWLTFRIRFWVAAGFAALCLYTGYLAGGGPKWPGHAVFSAFRNDTRRTAIDALLAGDRPVNVVVADSALVMLQALNGSIPSVDDYSGHTFLLRPVSVNSSADAAVKRLIDDMPVTSLADVSFVTRILKTGERMDSRIQVRHARDISPADLGSGDAVILGGPRVNPWAALFQSQLNFQFRYSGVGPGCFVNTNPGPAELARYGDCSSIASDIYARIAWLPNLRGTGHVLLISGNGMFATEGASDFLLETGSARRLLTTLGATDFSTVSSFEILLLVSHRARAVIGEHVLAQRIRRS